MNVANVKVLLVPIPIYKPAASEEMAAGRLPLAADRWLLAAGTLPTH